MLDLHRISDNASVEQIDPEDYLGALSLVEHKTLRAVFDQPGEPTISFFADTRLSYQQVQVLLNHCRAKQDVFMVSNKRGNMAYGKLITMLEDAVTYEQGVLFLCD